MSNFSIEPYFDPIKQWRWYLTNDVAMRMPYDINDPLFLQKVSVLQAEQVKHMVASSYSQTAAFRDETSANFAANRHAMEKGMNMLGGRITQVGGMITSSLEKGFAAMNYGFTDLSNKAEIANAYLSDINKGIALSNQYSQQLVQTAGQLNAGVAQVNRNLSGVNNNLIAINRTLSAGFAMLSVQLSAISSKLDSILEELKIPETQRERRYHIHEGMKYLAQATKDNDDLYFEDALDEFNKAISIESKDFFSHYYAGYIYMYSKEHLDIDKAIYHLRRFIHYAKAAIDTASAKSLWDDGCFNLSLAYYIQENLSEAIQTIAMQTSDSEKVLLQQAKYLSLGNDVEKRQAMQVVTKILKKNPYAVMLLMQDRDMLMNPYLSNHIDHLRFEAYSEAKDCYLENQNDLGGLKREIEMMGTKFHNVIIPLAKHFKKDLNALLTELNCLLDENKSTYNRLVNKNTFLGAIELRHYYLSEMQVKSGAQKKTLELVKDEAKSIEQAIRVINGINMIKVEGGTFWMGDPREYRDNREKPVHKVTLDSYYIAEAPVTRELWRIVMCEKNISSNYNSETENTPMIASYNECQEFIRKLNKMTGKKFCMPTEAEWEYAARGGKYSHGYTYAGSNTIDDVAWYISNSHSLRRCPPVKAKKPNELGIYDMSGYVKEWCSDYYDEYSSYSEINPRRNSPIRSIDHIVRGGDCGCWPNDVSVYRRFSSNPSSGNGLRLCSPIG